MSATAPPETKRRFAELLGRGATVKEASQAIGWGERTCQGWLAKEPELREIAQQTREAVMDPNAVDVCKDALTATKRDGSPDWQSRLTAARLLLLTVPKDAGGASGDPAKETTTVTFHVAAPEPAPETREAAEQPPPEPIVRGLP